MVEDEDEKIPPEVKKDLLKEGWTPPEGAPDALGAGEGQAPDEASETAQQVSDKQIERGNKEYTELETKQNFAEIPADKTSDVPAEQKKFICEECGKPFDTRRALTGHMQIHSRKKKKEETKKLGEKGKPLVPYAEMGEPEDFLRGFLEGYEFKDKFIDLLCRRVVLREELPHPNDLAADILTMEGSGVKSSRNASAIAEDYGYAFKKYLDGMGEQNNRPHTVGYDTRSSESSRHHGGIPRHDDHDEEPRGSRGIPMRGPQRDRAEEERRPDRQDLDRHVTMRDILSLQKEDDLRRREEEIRLREDDGGGGRRRGGETPDWMQDRMEKLEEKIRQQDEKRMQRLEDELKAARNTPPPESVSYEDVATMVEGIFDARSKKLTTEDVQRIVRDQTAEFRVGLTKDDLEYLKAKDQYRLEERKLDEKGKTRDEFARIARETTTHIGQIVARTLTETGATTGTPTKGTVDQTGTVLQINCIGCGAAITAPIVENMITCSQCGRQYTVERLPHETPPSKETPVLEKPKETPEELRDRLAGIGPEEKKEIQNSLEDAKAGRITPLKVEEPLEPPKHKPEIPPKTGVEKIAENLAIGEGVKKLEEELKKEKKPEPSKKLEMPPIISNLCPICGKKCRSRGGVRLHAREVHPEYEY